MDMRFEVVVLSLIKVDRAKDLDKACDDHFRL